MTSNVCSSCESFPRGMQNCNTVGAGDASVVVTLRSSGYIRVHQLFSGFYKRDDAHLVP